MLARAAAVARTALPLTTQQQSRIQFRAMSAAAVDPVRHWALQYEYVSDVMEKRGPLRPAHLALANQFKKEGKMLQGGAFTEPPMGALLTFHTTRAEVESFIKQDPYVQSANPIVTGYKLRESVAQLAQRGGRLKQPLCWLTCLCCSALLLQVDRRRRFVCQPQLWCATQPGATAAAV